MSVYIGLCAINGKSKESQTPLNAARHNLRCIKAELRGGHIDAKRTRLNRVIRGPDTPEAIVELMERRIADYGATAKRKDQIKLFEVVVSLKQAVQDLSGFFDAAADWLACWFDCPLISAVVHYDEAEPHMHLLFVPLRDGRLQGDKVMGKRADLARMHKEFQAQVGARFGIEAPKRYSQRERASVADVVMFKLLRSMRPGSLTADQQFQLRKAVANASCFDDLMCAFGLGEQQTPIGVESHRPAAPENHSKNTDPYQCVGVAVSPSLQDQGKGPKTEVGGGGGIEEQTAQSRERDDDNEAAHWDDERGEYRPLSSGGHPARHDALDAIGSAMPARWASNERFQGLLRPDGGQRRADAATGGVGPL